MEPYTIIISAWGRGGRETGCLRAHTSPPCPNIKGHFLHMAPADKPGCDGPGCSELFILTPQTNTNCVVLQLALSHQGLSPVNKHAPAQ